ncbi:NADH dehydrogenase [ubiquinone] iron-sulfur protein 8-A [Pyrus ussuriensis x Pyrus communis]|uniref:NADH dehydrogenase [ubiquinone] iron-sulfur protein 8-A n=1 Tax=Pyrus ussuriensis x Pyrus communis TaxID=2448454 RepID=A0A5N5H6A9_9ROSA|nr:NADH dehydrogenase [ubiquinone] iron-sulfur protein 8-A [Pyrus ussuriensis x Pyrus communis]
MSTTTGTGEDGSPRLLAGLMPHIDRKGENAGLALACSRPQIESTGVDEDPSTQPPPAMAAILARKFLQALRVRQLVNVSDFGISLYVAIFLDSCLNLFNASRKGNGLFLVRFHDWYYLE